MPYEDLTVEERLAFHREIINKHRECERRLQMPCETDEEAMAQEFKVLGLMTKSIQADSFKTDDKEV